MDNGRVRKIIHIDVETFYSSFEPRNQDFKSRRMAFRDMNPLRQSPPAKKAG
jgi:hypothetical protein